MQLRDSKRVRDFVFSCWIGGRVAEDFYTICILSTNKHLFFFFFFFFFSKFSIFTTSEKSVYQITGIWNSILTSLNLENKRTNGPVNAHLRYIPINLFD